MTPTNATPQSGAGEQGHSPLPWKRYRSHQGLNASRIDDADGQPVCDFLTARTHYDADAANARIIEDRVNGWDALLTRAEAAEAANALLREAVEGFLFASNDGSDYALLAAFTKARATLATLREIESDHE